MTPRTGLLYGLAIGCVLAAAAAVVTLVVSAGAIQEREAAAYQRGHDEGVAALQDRTQGISVKLNEGLLSDNARFAELIQSAQDRLDSVLKRDDLSPDARAALQAARDELAGR